MLARPGVDEYDDYYHQYVERVPHGDILSQFVAQRDELESLLGGIDPAREGYHYAEGKWSIREVVGHIIDVERMFAYRTLVFARNDHTPLPSFEQDDYVAAADFDKQKLADLIGAFVVNRNAYLSLLRSFDEETWMRRGIASGFEFTVRSIPYIVVGHVAHHVAVLGERYL